MSELTITLLAGGVGGAKAAEGLAISSYANATSIIGNIADDDEFHGLWISPDIDTLLYSLSDQIDRKQGWGRKNESHNVLNELKRLGEDTWMTLGDLDLATHIYRTNLKHKGIRASEVTRQLAEHYGINIPILLPTDNVVQTRVKTDKDDLSFQEYFVREQCQPNIIDIYYQGLNEAKPTQESLSQIAQSDIIIIAPSNPIVSIGAILAIPGIKDAITNSGAYVIAISPLISGKTVKGPADKMLASTGKTVDSKGIYECYSSFLNALVIDEKDKADAGYLESKGINVLVTPTLMSSKEDKRALLEKTVDFSLTHIKSDAA